MVELSEELISDSSKSISDSFNKLKFEKKITPTPQLKSGLDTVAHDSSNQSVD